MNADLLQRKALELFAAELDKAGMHKTAEQCINGTLVAGHLPAIRAIVRALAAQTPAAEWRANGEPDPHDTRYDCERAKLAGGHLTDDQVANAVYLDPSIVNLTIAKDRIRWLSRALVAATEGAK